jgi:alkanesulfonate monooxygenase SsuD/methylene tetrahydromethanopterin reductase-like flavin-dependent oxidoreductase (luciferase family)
MLPAIAAVTERVRVGPLVSPTSVHHPAVLANRAATIDHLSNGRFVLGMGAGWQINEHQAYGIELQAPGSASTGSRRRSRSSGRCSPSDAPRSRASTTGSPTHRATRSRAVDPLPILIGTGSPRMLRITARTPTSGTPGERPRRSPRRARAFDSRLRVGRPRPGLDAPLHPGTRVPHRDHRLERVARRRPPTDGRARPAAPSSSTRSAATRSWASTSSSSSTSTSAPHPTRKLEAYRDRASA